MAVLAVAAAAIAGGASARSAHCAAAGSTVLSSSTARVYVSHGRYFGCLKQSGRVRFLALAHSLTFPESRVSVDTTTFAVGALGGDWVAWSRLVNGTLGNSTWIDSIDLASGTRHHVKAASDLVVPEGLAVSRSGQLGWLMPYPGGTLPVGTGAPSGLTVTRLGGDHHPDLVFLSSDGVAAMRGLGAGHFSAASTLVTGKNPLTFAVADVNGDGIPDLVLGGGLGDIGVTVHLGRSDGSFGPSIATSVPLNSVDVLRSSDLNHDGRADVVVASQDPGSLGKIVVLISRGNGHFAAPVTYKAGTKNDLIGAMAIGDATGDGRPDVVAGTDTKILILRGRGDGTFAERPPIAWHEHHGPGIGAIAIGDLNRDHHPDLVLAASYVEVLLGRAHGGFAPITRYRVNNPLDGVGSLALGDVNGDGRPDVVAGETHGFQLATLTTRRSGALNPARLLRVHNGQHFVALGDLRGSGHLDIADANFDESSMALLFGRGNGRFFGQTLNQDLYVWDSTGARKVSSDTTIPAASLRFSGSVLRWRSNGAAQSLTLH